MNINEWFSNAKNQLDKEELHHLKVHKGKIELQLKNELNGRIEIHTFIYTSKDTQNLKLEVI